MFTKGQSGELAWVTSSNIPFPPVPFFKSSVTSLWGKLEKPIFWQKGIEKIKKTVNLLKHIPPPMGLSILYLDLDFKPTWL